MSIDMYLGPSKTQGSTTTSVCNNYQSGLTGLQEAISNFTADQVLRSLAYDSAKGYFQEAYVPLIQGAILVVEATAKAVEKLPTDYVAQVDSCDLKSSELEREIQQYEVQIQGMQEQIEQVKELLPVSSERVQHIREANGLISDYTNAKAKLEKQLQKLLAFHAFSTMIFVEVTSLKNAIDQGLAQVSGGKGFNAQKGTFSNGNLKDRSWMDTIGKKWQEREKERLKDQMPNMDGLEYKQIDFNGGKVWCWVKEGRTTADPEDIEKTFLYNDWVARMLKKYGSDYFTPEREPGVMDLLVEQNLRLFEELRTGIDSKTGKKLTPLERLARGTSLANSLAALGVGAKQITNVGRGKSSQSPTKSPIINRGPRVNDIGKSNKTITVPGKKIQSVKGKPSRVKAPGKASGAEKINQPIENGPYIKNGKPNGRPQLSGEKKLQFEKDVYNNQVDPDGILRDPNTGETIDWQVGNPRKNKVDFGHTEGNSYKNMFEKYKNGEITLDELKEFQFNSDNFRLETPSANRSHQYE